MSDELSAAERELRAVVERMGLVAGRDALPTLLAEYDRRGAEMERLRARVAELDPKERESRARAEALRRCTDEGDDDEGHGPWHYMAQGILCSCGHTVDRDEMCTRPRTSEGIHAERVGALFEAADNLLHDRQRGAVADSYYDDLQACVDALTVDADDAEVPS